MLYAHGAPMAVNRGGGSRGYLGTDIMGSTRSVTDSHGVQEGYYDYDVFGNPVTGDFTTGVDYGYLGKSYDSRTGLYNYGYRDYNPQTVRFTTVDPIRDGTNWFAYVNNDPVNYVDLWGLCASEPKRSFWSKALDGIQTGLDIVGLVPGVGEIADGANALISLVRGDPAGAALSAMSMVPMVGDALGKGGKIARAAIKHGDEVVEVAGSTLKGIKAVENASDASKVIIPDKAKKLIQQIKINNGVPPKGYKGGKTYKNVPVIDGAQKLPEGVNYKEYDINPYVKGQNRGTERIVIGDDGSVWYTNDHYFTFTKIE